MRSVWTTLLLTSALACLLLGYSPQAQARLMQETLASGEPLYKSLRSLQDNHGYSWQLIAFKTGSEPLAALRLVGFPTVPALDHQAPLIVQTGETQVSVADQTPSFGAAAPPPTVAQYPLAPILAAARSPAPITLILPNQPAQRGRPNQLHIPRSILKEWRAILKCELDCRFNRA